MTAAVEDRLPDGVGTEPGAPWLSAAAPALIWVALLLALIIGSERAFRDDARSGFLQQMMRSPAPLPLLMLKCCGGNDDPFGTVSKGTHWAQFMSGFFFTGVIALPCMLFSTNLIGVPSLILSLSGIVMAIIVGGVIACLAARESSDPLSFQAW